MNFQRRLIISFLVVFALFAALIVVFEQSRARRYKTEALVERLDAYADEVERFFLIVGGNAPVDSLLRLLPPEIRLTLVGSDGTVLFDNVVSDPSGMENHASRPEIMDALARGDGTFIRTSASNNRPYLYYAKRSDNATVIRVAMPYDVEVHSFLKTDNAFLYFVVALFIIGLASIFHMERRFGASFKRLREHEAREKTRRLKQEMTGNIAHELRTPVTSIRGFLEILLNNELDTSRAQEYLRRAYSQTQTLSALISDMSLLARLDERRDAFSLSEVDAAELLRRVRTDTASALAEKNISMAFDIPQGLILRGNESLLYSVFRNLTDNVISHAGHDIAIRIGATVQDDGGVRISFSDTGAGISDPRHLDRLFERFYRVNEGRTRDTGGSGLGLSIVKNTVQFHGGTITVNNNIPSGLEFVIVLPRRPA